MDVGRSFVDLHNHSSASFDALSDPAAMVERARRMGLTHLAITDHERIDGAQRARDLADPDVQVIVGEEIRTLEGDLIGLFLEHAVAPGMSAADTAAAVHAQGGLVGLPHPFDRFRSSGAGGFGASDASEERLERLAGVVDYVEVHNARAYRDANPMAAGFAARHELPGVAVSDAHTLMEVGIASTVLDGHFSTAARLLELLPGATHLAGRTSYYVRLWTPWAKLVQGVRGNRRITPSRAAAQHDAS